MSKMTDAISEMTEEEKAIIRKRMNEEDKPYTGFKITVFFPDKEELDPITITGEVPKKGDIIYIGNWLVKSLNIKDEDKGRDFTRRRKWVVTNVYYSIRTGLSLKENLLYDNVYKAEVNVKQYFSLGDWWWWWAKTILRRK